MKHRSSLPGLKYLAPLAFAIASPLGAATSTGTLAVTALVVDTCTVTGTPLAFAALNTSAVTNNTGVSTIAVVCTSAKTGITVTLDGGSNADGTRRMASTGGNFVPYGIYSNEARTTAVGIGGTIYSGDVAAVVPTAINVYGQVPAGSYAAGAYVDAVTITVTY